SRWRFYLRRGNVEPGRRKNLQEGGDTFCGNPILCSTHAGAADSAIRDELLEKRVPGGKRLLQLDRQVIVLKRSRIGTGWQSNESEQRVVQFFGVPHVRPRFVTDFRNGLRTEPADFSEHRFGQHAAHLDRAGAAFFERSIVEI